MSAPAAASSTSTPVCRSPSPEATSLPRRLNPASARIQILEDMDLELVERAIADFTPDGPDAPGLAVGVYSGGRAVHTAARGVATVESDAPIDARTRFDIASASKQFTAACVLMLAHEGRLSLDDDIRKHVPELALESEVTIGQCLNHTGGLPEWYALQAITGVPLQVLTEERLMKIISRIRRTTFEPGTAFSYSNTGYVLAAVVVRWVTGKSLAEFAAERVFGPLGMDDTVYRDDASVPLPRMAFGYAAGPVRADTEEGAVGDGGLVPGRLRHREDRLPAEDLIRAMRGYRRSLLPAGGRRRPVLGCRPSAGGRRTRRGGACRNRRPRHASGTAVVPRARGR
ncbi:serine hydrolase domain-containing protein [Microtetraspora malaysiensis]|uniref:serine hydrolase domain-containing protein n=1 Tax=Microtetraspora malaysiensis TaxID=161358 RepID=UPI003D925890